jgi:phosphatidylethanolamine/phosphatidyl-N-methylethanolamine N-methyltransferase
LDLRAVEQAYRRYARFYDVCFGAVFQPGRKAIVERMDCSPGERILEVGVGTGLSLPLYPQDVSVVGIDISREMLQQARTRLARDGLEPTARLMVMDAENMAFEDDSFDKVVAMYVASVVPNPAAFAAEIRRVCRPGGTIVLVNHFASDNGVMWAVEKLLAPLAAHIGFHADFSLDNFLKVSKLSVREIKPSNLFGYWRLLRCVNEKPATS